MGRGPWITISWLVALIAFGRGAAGAAAPETPVAPAEILVCWAEARPKAALGEAARLAGVFGLVDETALWPVAARRSKQAVVGPGLGSWSRLRFGAGVDPRAAATAYAGLEGVRWAQPNYLRRSAAVPDDSLFAQQWSLPAMGWNWGQEDQAEAVVVAIIDSGVDWHHPDLAGRIWENPAETQGLAGVDDDANGYVDDLHGWDFSDAPGMPGEGDYLGRDADPDDESGHGTHVAGIIGAVPDNGIGIAGVAPGARLMVLRAGFNIGGSAFLEDDDVAAAIVYAADQGARVVNMSFGDPNVSPLIRDVVDYAAQRGCILVAAAGNESSDEVFYPARFPEVIAVGATGREQQLLPFSNYGYSLDLAAPGLAVLSLLPGGGYVERSGTSMAAAQVSGLAAAVLSRHPEFSRAQVKGALVQRARDVGAPGWDVWAGAGLVQWSARGVQDPPALELGGGVRADSVRVALEAPVEGMYEVAWSLASGPENWIEMERGSVTGRRRLALVWPPAGLGEGTYLVRARLAAPAGAGAIEDRTAFSVVRQPGRVLDLKVHRALDGEVWAQVANWASAGSAADTLSIYREGELEPLYRMADYPKGPTHWVPLPTDLEPGRYQAQVGDLGPGVSFTVVGDPVQRWSLDEVGLFPEGYLLPEFPDFNTNGRRELVAMRLRGNRYNPVDFFEAGRGEAVFSSPLLFIPWARTDLDNDGRGELLAVDAQRVRLIEASTSGGFPVESVWQQQDAWGGEAADLDGDGRPELFLRSARAPIFQVLEASGDNTLRETAVLANPTAGANEAGERQVAGDLDGDGKGELLSGDSDGDLFIHEAIGDDAYRLTWQEAGEAPGPDARLVGGGVDLDGDGRTEFVVGRLRQDLYDPRQTRWSIEVYQAQADNQYGREWQVEALGGKAGGNGINLGDWDGDGQVDIAVALPPHLYVFTAAGADTYKTAWQAGAGEVYRPAAGDLDGDGRVDLAFNNGQGIAVFSGHVGLPRPLGLRARPVDGTRVALEWTPVVGAEGYRVYRDGVLLPAAVGTPVFEDRGLHLGTTYTYQVSVVVGGDESARSAAVPTQPQPPPQVLAVGRLGSRQLAVAFDQPMAEPEPYRLRVDPGVGQPSSVLLDASGRRLVLGFERVLPDSGGFVLTAQGLSSAVGGALAEGQHRFTLAPYREPARLVGVRVEDPARLVVEFSEPIGVAKAGDFVLEGGGQQVVGAEPRGNEVLLQVDPPLRPLGRRYALQVDGVVSVAGDRVSGRALVALAASDLSGVCFFPNPYRTAVGRATFGCLPAGAE
ncbi:MAG: S8 family serine peptidase, partial [Candidatus Latescibacteria bacterium]|nr:S8 family serine peptidase [Candidatus Latescibacterota bacterium]